MTKSKSVIAQKIFSLLAMVALVFNFSSYIRPTYAQVTTGAKVSITFDDGYSSVYTKAMPVMEARGIKGTMFITTSYMGQTEYMTWTQVQALQNTYGWEIGSHSVNHTELPTVTTNTIKSEIKNSLTTLKNKGLNVTSFSTPYGAYNNTVLAEIAKSYNLHRGFWDRSDLNAYPYNRIDIMVQNSRVPADVKTWVDQAIAQNKWLVLVFHDVQDSFDAADPDNEDMITTADFTQMMDYIKSTGIQNVLMNHTLEKPGTNMLVNNTFDNGIADGWTTDNATQVVKDTATNGSYPSAVNSIKMTGGTKAAHLFTPIVAANPNANYQLGAFVNSNALTAGEIGFYVDEYDAGGGWISGKWLGLVPLVSVRNFIANYKPTSVNVASFKVQTYLTANSTGTAYVDAYELYNLDPTTPPPAEPTNLVANGSFETVANNFPTNWRTDSTNFVLDTTSKGNNGVNSMRLGATTAKGHLFSDKVAVTYGTVYQWSQYLKIASGTGEFGFYVDEYDKYGNWISGQWLGMMTGTYQGIKNIKYRPSSSRVASVGLQYYTVANSSLDVTLDSVKLTK